MIINKNIHEKLLTSIQEMLIDTKVNLPYYGEFNLHVNFHESSSLPTCGVNVTTKGMNFYYNPQFLQHMSQKEVNFVTLHEDFHLLFNHPRRTITGQYDHKLANIAQDMIINHIIWDDISHNFVEVPKSEDGKNMALFLPKEYTGKLIFEELYTWLKDEKEKWDEKQKNNKGDGECKTCEGSGQKPQDQGQGGGKGEGEGEGGQGQGQGGEGEGEGEGGQGQGNGQGQGQGGGHSHGSGEPCPDCGGTGNEGGKDSTGKPAYGPYGQNPSGNGSMDTWSKEQIFQDMEKNEGQYLDQHMGDEVPEEMRETMVRDVMDRLAARGLASGNIETTLNRLQKKRKDYLKEIKRSISHEIFGTKKNKTITRLNRRGIAGLKGNRKSKTTINVILDTSGSMGGQGTFERVLSFVYQNDIEINFIQGDTEVKWVEKFKKKRQLETMKIRGLGGTVMQPSINHVVEHYNEYNSVLLTDGYTDTLDLSGLKGKLLIISVGVEVPIRKPNKKGCKQICIEETH
jgi:predicted metal-dependent peptidase